MIYYFFWSSSFPFSLLFSDVPEQCGLFLPGETLLFGKIGLPVLILVVEIDKSSGMSFELDILELFLEDMKSYCIRLLS